ncbi:MAG: DUF2460 domain-containing protein [Pseudomonadota bacterium]
MSAFHDVRFPFPIALGARGGPQRLTEIVELASGREERNTPWAHSRRRWDAGSGVRSLDDLAELLAFFEARRGQLHAFRFRDPLDHKSCKPSLNPSIDDQVIGQGDGVSTAFALVKHYADQAGGYVRPIGKPVVHETLVAVDGIATEFQLDDEGQVLLASAPVAGAIITAGFIFDTPVRFDSDRLDIQMDAFEAGEPISVPLIEVRL